MSSSIEKKTDQMIYWAQINTENCTLAIAYDEHGRILRSSPMEKIEGFLDSLETTKSVKVFKNNKPPAAIIRKVQKALGGTTENLLETAKLTTFQRLVLQEVSKIRIGEIATYKEIAIRIGSPRSARAVGSAVATNPFPILIPCHRVIRTDGKIGDYSYGGSKVKSRLLKSEISIEKKQKF